MAERFKEAKLPSTGFAAPILPGKTEAWKAACAEIAGPRRQEYLQARRNLGITKEVACLQQMPDGDLAVVYIEANDTSRILQDMVEATDTFHMWFKQAVLQDVHGIGASQLPPINQPSLNIL